MKEFASRSVLLMILFFGCFPLLLQIAVVDTFSAILEAPPSQRPCLVYSTLKMSFMLINLTEAVKNYLADFVR